MQHKAKEADNWLGKHSIQLYGAVIKHISEISSGENYLDSVLHKAIYTRVKEPFRVFHLLHSPLKDSLFLSYFGANYATSSSPEVPGWWSHPGSPSCDVEYCKYCHLNNESHHIICCSHYKKLLMTNLHLYINEVFDFKA